MSEIADLENRLSAALDRIAQGLDQVGAAEVTEKDDGEVAALRAEVQAMHAIIETERDAKEALQEQLETSSAVPAAAPKADDAVASTATSDEIEALKKAHEAELDKLRIAATAEREAWEGLNSRLVRMRRSNKLMRTNTIALRQAAADMVVDASLINQSLQVELDAVRAAQELERAEADVILKTLQPMLGEPQDLEQLEETV